MIDAARLRELIARRGVSQAELARRIGVSQATVNKLAMGHSYGSKHLHRIARELGTTPAYLEGEVHDADFGAAPPPPAPPPRIMLEVILPPERALARMFSGLLKTIPATASMDEQALLLAKRLPNALTLLRDLASEASGPPPAAQAQAEDPAAPAKQHREPAR